MARRSLLSLWSLLVVTACDSDMTVPFKRGSSGAQDPSIEQLAARVGHVEGDPPARKGEAYPPLTRLAKVSGRELSITDGELRATLALGPADSPEAAVALLSVRTTSEGRIELGHSLPDDSGPSWRAPAALATIEQPDVDCSLESAALTELSVSYGLAELTLGCAPRGTGSAGDTPTTPAAPATPAAPTAMAPSQGTLNRLPDREDSTAPARPAPPSPDEPEPSQASPASPSQRREVALLLGLVGMPRVLERFTHLETTAGPALRWTFSTTDQDADGHEDVRLELELQRAQGPSERVTLTLWNRPSGLARDESEPEATLLELGNQAKQSRKGKPSDALAFAERALALHAALCREGGRAVLVHDDSAGLSCGSSLGAGRAASVRVAVLAAQGRVLEALEQQAASSDERVYQLTDNDRERVRHAFDALLERDSHRYVAGPRVAREALPPLHRPALAFLDEHRVLIRGSTARVFDLRTGETTPQGIASDRILRDPSGKVALVDLFRSCDGYQLDVVPSARVVAGVVSGKPLAQPLIEAVPPPAGTRCPTLPPSVRAQRGEYRVLEWTREGVVLARGRDLLVLALDAAGRATAPARLLDPRAPIPALREPDAISADARFYAVATPLGIALLERATGRARLIAGPESSAQPSEVALSPSGTRFAVLAGSQLFVAVPAQESSTRE